MIQKKRLPEMAKFGTGTPSTIWEGNFMKCTWTIQPKSMTKRLEKNRVREKPTKEIGPREQSNGEKLTGNSGCEKILTLYSQIHSELCTDCGM